MTRIKIIQDTRERTPILFPSMIPVDVGGGRQKAVFITVVKKKLQIGDYALAGAVDRCVVERKASISEIFKNMVDPDDCVRQLKAFDKLATVAHPILMVESTVSDLFRPTKYAPTPGIAVDRLCRELIARGISLWLVGNCKYPTARRKLGELVARLLLAAETNAATIHRPDALL